MPSTALSTWVVEVLCLPPPTNANLPDSTASTIAGRTVVSPGPQTKRGRTTVVAKSPRVALRTARSALAYVDEALDARRLRRPQHPVGALDVDALEVLRRAPVLDLRGGVEGVLAAGRARANRVL